MPGKFRVLWEGWRRFARRIGDIQARLLLIIFYFVVLAPFALLLRWRTDPLALRDGSPPQWRPRPDRKTSPLEQARKQS